MVRGRSPSRGGRPSVLDRREWTARIARERACPVKCAETGARAGAAASQDTSRKEHDVQPKEVLKWGPVKWLRDLKCVHPSGGGAVGVAFAWTTVVPEKQKPSTADFVIKPIQGTAAPTKFAEKVLSKIANAKSPNSEGIRRMSAEGEALVTRLRELAAVQGMHKDRWGEVLKHYENATTFLIMETQSGVKEFGDEYREQQGLRKMLRDRNLMQNLGLLCAADALIGNGDRFDSVNTGNIMFTTDGRLASIDSAAILVNFQAMLNDTHQLSWCSADNNAEFTPKVWGTLITRKPAQQVPTPHQAKEYERGFVPALPTTFVLDSLTDTEKLWARFRDHLESGIKREDDFRAKKGQPPIVPPRPQEWETGRAAFIFGVESGIRRIDQMLSGWNWIKFKGIWSKTASKYGADPNMDWTNLKVRRLFLRMLAKGKSSKEIYETVDKYVKKKGKKW